MLRRAHVTADLPAWETNRIKRITAQGKRQLLDAAFALAIARISPTEFENNPTLAGRYFESWVASQLRPECDALDAQPFHVQTKGGDQEIDLLVQLPEGLIAIEVKAGTRPTASDADHLQWLQRQLGSDLLAAVVLHRGDHTFELTPGVWAVPMSTLWSATIT